MRGGGREKGSLSVHSLSRPDARVPSFSAEMARKGRKGGARKAADSVEGAHDEPDAPQPSDDSLAATAPAVDLSTAPLDSTDQHLPAETSVAESAAVDVEKSGVNDRHAMDVDEAPLAGPSVEVPDGQNAAAASQLTAPSPFAGMTAPFSLANLPPIPSTSHAQLPKQEYTLAEIEQWRTQQVDQKQNEVSAPQRISCSFAPPASLTTVYASQLADIVDKHDDLVRELFHLDRFVTLIGFDPAVAKGEDLCSWLLARSDC